MKNLFVATDRQEILQRLEGLGPASARHWGKMNAAQMLAHCAAALEVATGDVPKRQRLIGRIFAPFVKPKLLRGEAPMMKNAPTDPGFVISDERDLARERERLAGLVQRLARQGSEAAGRRTHSFFGRLTGDEWGVLMYKHLDHHLRQFGA